MKTKNTLFAFFFALLWVSSAFGLTFPEYNGESVYTDASILSERQIQSLKTRISTYEAETGNQIGIILVEDSKKYESTFPKFINTVENKGYTPAGFLLTVDLAQKQTHLALDSALSYANAWESEDTNRVLNTILPQNFQKGDFYGGITDFINYVEEEIPQSIAAVAQRQTQNEEIAELARGDALKNSIFWGMLVLFLIIAVYFGTMRVQKWLQRRRLARIQTFFNETLPLFEADLDHFPSEFDELLPYKQKYESQLAEIKQDLTNFFEQEEKTVPEAKNWVKKADEMENALVEFINNPEKVANLRQKAMFAFQEAEKKHKKALSDVDL